MPKELKVISDYMEAGFDNKVTQCLSLGWELFSCTSSALKHRVLLTAFLTREKPTSDAYPEPSAEEKIISGIDPGVPGGSFTVESRVDELETENQTGGE